MTGSRNEPLAPRRAMVIAAHPDDIEFVVAGTAAKWQLAMQSLREITGALSRDSLPMTDFIRKA